MSEKRTPELCEQLAGRELMDVPEAFPYNNSDHVYWVWLSLVCGPASIYPDRLLPLFGSSAERIYAAAPEQIDSIDFLRSDIRTRLKNKDLSAAQSIIAWCESVGVGIMTIDERFFPDRLRRIPDKPIVLYYRGHVPDVNRNVCVAMVGTRRVSSYGMVNAYTIAYDCAKSGAVVISGIAKGIDSSCHRGALDAGGYTIGVLGCGIDIVYPKENYELFAEMGTRGTIITEYPPGTPPRGKNFPSRNRIISGMSHGTFVVEADESSGALITAKYAKQQGRDLFALPGAIGELNSLGPNMLLKEGASIVTDARDIIMKYSNLYPGTVDVSQISERPSPFRNIHAPHKKRSDSGKIDGASMAYGGRKIRGGTSDIQPLISVSAERESRRVLGQSEVSVLTQELRRFYTAFDNASPEERSKIKFDFTAFGGAPGVPVQYPAPDEQQPTRSRSGKRSYSEAEDHCRDYFTSPISPDRRKESPEEERELDRAREEYGAEVEFDSDSVSDAVTQEDIEAAIERARADSERSDVEPKSAEEAAEAVEQTERYGRTSVSAPPSSFGAGLPAVKEDVRDIFPEAEPPERISGAADKKPSSAAAKLEGLNEGQLLLYSKIREGVTLPDDLAKALGTPIWQLMGDLTLLQLRGLIYASGGFYKCK